MRRSITRTIGIRAPATRVLNCLSRPENLPDWLKTIVKAGGGSPGGFRKPAPRCDEDPLEVIVDSKRGTVDWVWASSGSLEMAAARVIPVDGGAQVVVTFFEPPKTCEGCTSLEERSAAVEADLLMLKALLESGAKGPVEIWH